MKWPRYDAPPLLGFNAQAIRRVQREKHLSLVQLRDVAPAVVRPDAGDCGEILRERGRRRSPRDYHLYY
jgi:hypothetical protein